MTETELRLIAAPAMIGLSSKPKNGYLREVPDVARIRIAMGYSLHLS